MASSMKYDHGNEVWLRVWSMAMGIEYGYGHEV